MVLDFWNGESCSVVQVGYTQNCVSDLHLPLTSLFERINHALTLSASVLRFKVFLQVVNVLQGGICDALDSGKRLAVGAEGICQPEPSRLQLFSAEECFERVKVLNKSSLHKKGHQVFSIRLERWVKIRTTGLLTPKKSKSFFNDDDSNNWKVTSSVFRLVNIKLRHSHTHRVQLDKDTVQTLNAFCRCVSELGTGFRDSKLTHLLQPMFNSDTRCCLMATIVSVSDSNLCTSEPLKFCSRVIKAIPIHTKGNDKIFEKQVVEVDDVAVPLSHQFSHSVSLQVDDLISSLKQGLTIPGEDLVSNDNSGYIHDTLKASFNNMSRSYLTDNSKQRNGDEKFSHSFRSSHQDEGLQASRDALRDELVKFQLGSDLLRNHMDNNVLLSQGGRLEEENILVKRLENDRREALEKGRGLMEQVWLLDGEKNDGLHRLRIQEETIRGLEEHRQAQKIELEQLRQSSALELENMTRNGSIEFQKLKETYDSLLENERARFSKELSAIEAKRNADTRKQNESHQELITQFRQEQSTTIEEINDNAEKREKELKERAKRSYEEVRKLQADAKLKDLERDGMMQKLEDEITNLKTANSNMDFKTRLGIDSEIKQLRERNSELEDIIKNLEESSQLECQLLEQRNQESKDTIVTLKQAIEESHSKILEGENVRLEQTNELENRTNQVHKLQKVVDHQQYKIDTLESELKALMEKYEYHPRDEKNISLKNSNVQLKQQLVEKQLMIKDLQHEMVLLQRDDGVQTDVEERHRLKMEFISKNEEIQRLSDLCEEMSDAHGAVCEDLVFRNRKLESVIEELQSMQFDLDTAEKDLDHCRASWKADREKLVFLEQRSQGYIIEIEQLGNSLQACQERSSTRYQDLMRKLEVSQQDSQRLKSKNQLLEAKIQEFDLSAVKNVYGSSTRMNDSIQDRYNLSTRPPPLFPDDENENSVNRSLARALRERDVQISKLQRQLESPWR